MTILGVKKFINVNINKLDDYKSHSLKLIIIKKLFKTKSKLLLNKINKIKKYGKKNSS